MVNKNREEGKAYECEKKICDCHEKELKHCPGCGDIYLFDQDDLKEMCLDCTDPDKL